MTVKWHLTTPLDRDPLGEVAITSLSLADDGTALLIGVATLDGGDTLVVRLSAAQRTAVRNIVAGALEAEYGGGSFEVT